MKTISDFYLKNKRVLVRCDFNVPLNKKGQILDDFRIKENIPTIRYLIKKGAKVILMSHLGRKRISLRPVAVRLKKLLKYPVTFLEDCIGEKTEERIKKMMNKEIILLENLRYHKEEKENNKRFAKQLARLADIYINNAFSVCHRRHASVVAITQFLPSGAGFLLEKELKILSQIAHPKSSKIKRPLLVIIGGNKVEDKALVVRRFTQIADFILISHLIAKEVKKMKIKNPEKVFSPVDSKNRCDIGLKTIKIFKAKILESKTIFWAGPLGKIEEKRYQRGTREIAKAITSSKNFSIVGGGDTIKFLNKIHLTSSFDYAFCGGGATLKFLAGEKLPGIIALEKNKG